MLAAAPRPVATILFASAEAASAGNDLIRCVMRNRNLSTRVHVRRSRMDEYVQNCADRVRELLVRSALAAARDVVCAADKTPSEWEAPMEVLSSALERGLPRPAAAALEPPVVRALLSLWADERVHAAAARHGSEVAHFMRRLHVVAARDYVPNDEDAIVARGWHATGVVEWPFSINRTRIKLITYASRLGAHAPAKMHHMFSDVTAVAVVASLASYCAPAPDNGIGTGIHAALRRFRETVRSRWFKDKPHILLLSDADIFKRRLQDGVPLDVAFPEYSDAGRRSRRTSTSTGSESYSDAEGGSPRVRRDDSGRRSRRGSKLVRRHETGGSAVRAAAYVRKVFESEHPDPARLHVYITNSGGDAKLAQFFQFAAHEFAPATDEHAKAPPAPQVAAV